MPTKPGPRQRGRGGRVTDVRFMEVEFAAPAATRIELEGALDLATDPTMQIRDAQISSLRSRGGAASELTPIGVDSTPAPLAVAISRRRPRRCAGGDIVEEVSALHLRFPVGNEDVARQGDAVAPCA